MSTPERLKFRCSDGVFLTGNRAAFLKSPTIHNFITNSTDPTAVIPLDSIRSNVMRLIIAWCEHHIDYPTVRYQDYDRYERPVTEFDHQLMDSCQNTLYDLLIACSFLELKGLSHVGANRVARNVRGMGPEQMREYFGIPNNEEDDDVHEEP